MLGIIVFLSFSGMTIRFNKMKLVEVQEKKAKASLIGGILTSSMAKSQDRRPASPTSSLELIVSLGGNLKAKATSKASIASFWEDAGTAVQNTQDTISVEDLELLMGKSPRKLIYVTRS